MAFSKILLLERGLVTFEISKNHVSTPPTTYRQCLHGCTGLLHTPISTWSLAPLTRTLDSRAYKVGSSFRLVFDYGNQAAPGRACVSMRVTRNCRDACVRWGDVIRFVCSVMTSSEIVGSLMRGGDYWYSYSRFSCKVYCIVH